MHYYQSFTFAQSKIIHSGYNDKQYRSVSKFFEEFKIFAMWDNVIDLAMSVGIGGAFNNVVNSLVGDITMPKVGLLIGSIKFTGFKVVFRDAQVQRGQVVSPEVALNYGSFIQVILNFIIVAFSIFLSLKLSLCYNMILEGNPYGIKVPFRDSIQKDAHLN